MIENNQYSTNDVLPSRRSDYWKSLLCATKFDVGFHPLERDDYWGYLKHLRTNQHQITQWHAAPAKVSRTTDQAKRSQSKAYEFIAVVKGSLTFSQRNRSLVVSEDDLVVGDASEAFILEHTHDVQALTFTLPHSDLDRLISAKKIDEPVKIQCQSGLAHLGLDYLKNLAREVESLSPNDFKLAARHFVEVAVTVLDGARDLSSSLRGSRAITFKRITRLVCDRIGDLEFSPGRLSQETGLSPRYLQSLFQSSGFTVQSYIRTQRLDRAQAMLRSPAYQSLSVTEIALQCGFSNPSHFSKAFRNEFDCSPTQFRQAGF